MEAQLEDGDDPAAVAAELRRQCETEVRQGAEQSRVLDKIGDAYDTLRRLENKVAGCEAKVKEARDTLAQFEGFLAAARKAGVHVPPLLAQNMIPF